MSVSKLRSETARRNGARSEGPVTPEGKAVASQNARLHGLLASKVVLHIEDEPEFVAFVAPYYQRYQPADPVEKCLVDQMAVAMWHQLRISCIHNALFNFRLDLDENFVRTQYGDLDDASRAAFTFMRLADSSNVIALLLRYDAHHQRMYERACRNLAELRRTRPLDTPEQPSSPPDNAPRKGPATAPLDPAVAVLPNEPKPAEVAGTQHATDAGPSRRTTGSLASPLVPSVAPDSGGKPTRAPRGADPSGDGASE